MTISKGKDIEAEYLELLDLAFDVAESIKGKKTQDYRMVDCQQLALKLYFHATTVYHLSKGTQAPVPYSVSGGSKFYDFASVAVLTRTIIENYLNLFEVFFEPIDDDEKEFRYQLWLLSGFVIREKYIPNDPGMKKRIDQSKKDIQLMRDKIANTKYYASLSKGQQKGIIRGKRLRKEWDKLAIRAGFGELFITQMYSYYSGYSHSDGLSGAQIYSTETKEKQLNHIHSSMRIIMTVLAKIIHNYYDYFSESKMACDKKPEAFKTSIVWSEIAKRMP